MTRRRRILVPLALATVVAATLAYAPSARAQCGPRRGGRVQISYRTGNAHGGYTYPRSYGYRSYRAPIVHAPTVSYARVYHQDSLQWTPRRGLHGHGHYDVVPHYVPVHVDTLHNSHIDTNSWLHH